MAPPIKFNRREKLVIVRAGRKYHIPARVLAAQIFRESGNRRDAVSSAGARGVTQFMPGTAPSYRVKFSGKGAYKSQVEGAAHYLSDLGYAKDPRKAIAGYAGGPGNPQYGYADALLETAKQYKGYFKGTDKGGEPRFKTKTTPGVDNSGARQQLLVDYLSERGKPGALLALAAGLDEAKDIPATTTRVKDKGPKVKSGHGGYPLAKRGKIIGTPFSGTHTLGNWQSDRAIDIAIPEGTPVLATSDGVIEKVSPHAMDGGRFAGDGVTVRGHKGDEYFFKHIKSKVHAGQKVKKGQVIGYSGSANGVAHLHFGRRRGAIPGPYS